MLSSVWEFVKAPDNQAALSWIGGGFAAVVAAIWTVIKFRAGKGDHQPSKPAVSADHGSVAAGGDFRNSPVNIDTTDRAKR
jgi:hypothetical protein